MNDMMAAFKKASEKDSDIKDLVVGANILHQKKIEEQQKRTDVWKKMMANNARMNKEKEDSLKQKQHDEAEIRNRNKPIWEWIVRPEKYSFDCGFIFADTEEEARESIAKLYHSSAKIKITKCDCSKSVILIASHYE